MRFLPLHGVGAALLFAVLLPLRPSWAQQQDRDGGAPFDPTAAVTAALEIHPDIQAAQAELARALGARAESALLLDNPQLSASTSVDRARQSAQLTQPLSLTGAGWHQRASSRAAANAAEHTLTRTRLVVSADTRKTYVAAVVATDQVRVAAEGWELAVRLAEAVTRQQEEGEASVLEVRLARLAQVKSAASLLQAREAQAEALSELAAQVGRMVPAESLSSSPLSAAPEPTQPTGETRTDIAAAQELLRAAEAELRLQRAQSLPSVGLGLFASVEDGQTFVGPSLTVEVPLFRRNQAGRAQAGAGVDQAGASVASTTARAEAQVRTASQRQREADQLSAQLLADPVAEARAALSSIEAGYLAGEIDLPSTVLLQAEVLEGEAAAAALLGQLSRARIDLLLATEDPALVGGAP